MNVLLLYPEFPNTFWSYSHALWYVGKRAVSPPLGLLTVGALLPESWGKKLVDLNVQRLKQHDLDWADYVFISAMSIQRASTQKLVQRCKAAGKKIVVGGPLFSVEDAFFSEVDHFVLNEAELTLPPFLADLERGEAKRIYRSEAYADLSESPLPMWSLLEHKHKYESMSVQYSRGCPFNCDFCSVTAMLGRKPRHKTAGQMMAELDALHADGWRGQVFFVDDNLIGNRAALKNDLLPALIEWQKTHGPRGFFTQVSIDLADDPELTREMTRAGFDTVFIGIETPEVESLVECGKKQNSCRDLTTSVKKLQRAGLEVQAGFIVGFDHDTPTIFQRQTEFIQKSGIVTAMVGQLQALTGTRLYDRMKQEGRLSGVSTGDNVDGTTNIIPRMGIERLREGYARLLKSIYAPRPYYKRVRTFLREYRRPEVRPPLTLSDVQAFLNSLLYLGVIGRERFEYWRLLLWTMVNRPSLFALAVRMAICGHHFRLCTEQHVGKNRLG